MILRSGTGVIFAFLGFFLTLSPAGFAASESQQFAPTGLVAGDRFGDGVAIDGDVLAVAGYGNAGNDGFVRVYHRNGANPEQWDWVKTLRDAGGLAGSFGQDVAVSGSTLVVGAFTTDTPAGVDSGTAYVYERDLGGSGQWGLVKEIHSSDLTAGDAFGIGVAIEGDTLVVGATGADGFAAGTGAVYVFERDTGGADQWGQIAKVFSADGGGGFGRRVALDQDRLIAGAITHAGTGAAFIFDRDLGGVDNWGQAARLLHPAGLADDWFGWDVAIAGDYAVVGMREANGPVDRQGAFVYARNLGGTDQWGYEATLVPGDAAIDERVGYAVAMAGADIFVGAIGFNAGSGRVLNYRRDPWGPDPWRLRAEMLMANPVAGNLGGRLAAQSGEVIAGAFSQNTAKGAAYLFGVGANPAIDLMPVAGDFLHRNFPLVHFANTVLGPAEFDLSDAESSAAGLVLSWETDNDVLLPPGSVVFAGSGPRRTMTVTPAADTTGSALVTVVVTDEDGDLEKDFFHLEIRERGAFGAWGFNRDGSKDLPADLGAVTKFAFGDWAGIALRLDGTLKTFGQNFGGSLSGLEALSGVRDIAHGDLFSVVVRSDGSLLAQGFNAGNRLSVPAGNDFVEVESGVGHTLARRSDGTLAVWGNSAGGPIPASILSASTIAAGYPGWNLAVSGGAVLGWSSGQWTGLPPELGSDVVEISLKDRHALARKSDGSVYAFGNNEHGQSTVPAIADATRVSAGKLHSLALTATGAVHAWGNNEAFQANVPAGLERVRVLEATNFGAAFVINQAPVLSGSLAAAGMSGDAVLLSGLQINDPDGYGDPVWVELEAADGLLTLGETSGLTFVTNDGVADDLIRFTADLDSANVALASLRLVGGAPTGGVLAISVRVDDAALLGQGSHLPEVSSADIYLSLLTAPEISPIADQTIAEDTTTGTLAFTLTDDHTAPDDLVLSVSSSDEALIPVSNISLAGTGPNRTISVSPVANASGGPVTITLSASDPFFTSEMSFAVTVTPDNDLPTLTLPFDAGSSWVHYAGSTLGPTTLTVGDIEDAAENLITNWSTDNPALLPTGAVVISGTGSAREVWVNLPAGVTGVAELTFAVTDTDGGSAERSFILDIRSIDTAFLSWGYNGFGQQDLPAGLHGVLDVAYSNTAALVVQGDGTLVAWGDDFHGTVSALNGQTNVAQVTAGDLYGIVRFADGSLLGGGWNALGRTSVPGGSDFIDIATETGFSLGLTNAGAVVQWGQGTPGRPLPAGLDAGVIAVAAGDADFGLSGALMASGEVRIWASWSGGGFAAIDPSLNGSAVDLEMGRWFWSWLREDGSVVNWGDVYGSGQVLPIPPAQAISARANQGFGLLEDGGLAGWGATQLFQANVPPGLSRIRFVRATPTGAFVARNLPPELSAGTAASGGQRTPILLPPVTISDPDSYDDPVRVTVSPEFGTVALGTTTGFAFYAGSGADDPFLDFSGGLADVNTALATLSYTPNPGVFGNVAITLTVDDLVFYGEGAHVPDSLVIDVTVDPIGVTLEDTEATGVVDRQFGRVLAADGDYLAVGAPEFEGRVTIYRRSSSNPDAWDWVKHIYPPSGFSYNFFGSALAMKGETLVVASLLGDVSGVNNAGAVFVYERDAGGAENYGLVATLTAPTPQASAQFGSGVALYLDRIVVGAMQATGSAVAAGAAYVYQRSPDTGWVFEQELFAANVAANDRFGRSVSIWSGTIAVGAEFNNDAGSDAGSVFVFANATGDPGAWQEVAEVLSPLPENAATFGRSVSLSGTLLAVGAPQEDTTLSDAGVVHLFERSLEELEIWNPVARIVAPEPISAGKFGEYVALQGAHLLVGERHADDAGEDSGRLHVFAVDAGGPGGWARTVSLADANLGAGAEFGVAAILERGTLVVGATHANLIKSFDLLGATEQPPEVLLDAPTLDPIAEDLEAATHFGFLVDRLAGRVGLDGNGDRLGLALTGTNSTDGDWEYSLDGGITWMNVGAVNETAALLLSPLARLRFVPDSNYSGTVADGLVFRLWDGRGGTAGMVTDLTGLTGGDQPFSATTAAAEQVVESVYDPTTISGISDQVVSTEDSFIEVPFTVIAYEVPIGAVTISATSNLPALIPNAAPGVEILGTGGARTLRLTPLPNRFGGPIEITIEADDSIETIRETFELTITPEPDAPFFVASPKDYILEPGLDPGVIPFTIDDVDAPASPLATIVVEATSSNQALIPDANLSLAGTDAHRTIAVTPVPGATGETTITLTLVDPGASPDYRVSTAFKVSIGVAETSLVGWGNENFYGASGTVREPLGALVAFDDFSRTRGGLRADGSLKLQAPSWHYEDVPMGVFTRYAAGHYISAAIDDAGQLYVWGNPHYVGTVPVGDFMDLALGYYGGVALRTDGSVASFGSYSRATIPAALETETFSAIGAGPYTFYGVVQSTGELKAWGWDSYAYDTALPVDTDIVEIEAGVRNRIGRKADGTLVSWGANTFSVGTIAATVTNAVDVALDLNGYLAIALLGDGRVVAWGSGFAGLEELHGPGSGIVEVSAGDAWVSALKADGSVEHWGNRFPIVPLVEELSDIETVEAGDYFGLALLGDGRVAGWGSNYNGQLDFLSEDLPPVRSIAAGYGQSVLVFFDGSVEAWGYNLGVSSAELAQLSAVERIEVSYLTAVALKTDGTISAVSYYADLEAAAAGIANVVDVAAGRDFFIALDATGTVHAFGDAGVVTALDGLTGVIDVAASDYDGFALKGTDGSVARGGRNYRGVSSIQSAPTPFAEIHAGGWGVIGIDADGVPHAYGNSPLRNLPFLDGRMVDADLGPLHGIGLIRTSGDAIQGLVDQEIVEDAPAVVVAFDVAEEGTDPNSITLQAVSLNPELISNATLALGGSGASRTLAFAPEPSVSGDARIVVRAEGESTVRLAEMAVTILPVNDAPSFVATDPPAVLEDAGAQTVVNWAHSVDLGPPNEDSTQVILGYLVNVTANAALFSVAPVVDPAGTLTYSPAADAHGSATFEVVLQDDGGTANGGVDTSPSQFFTITVDPVNDLPTISLIGNQVIDEDGAMAPVAFAIGDVETSAAALSLTVSSTNPTLVPEGNIVLGGSDENRTIAITPASDAFGTATMTITVEDADGATASTEFLLTVHAINDAPTISTVANQTIDEDGTTRPIEFVVGDAETLAWALNVSVTSSNEALVPMGNLLLGGSGATRTLTATPVPDGFGATTLSVIVTDASGVSESTAFLLTVNPVNDAPTITAIADQMIDEDTSTGALPFTVADVETDPGFLAVSASSSNQAVLPDGNLLLVDLGNGMWTIAATPMPDTFGEATITVTVSDGLDARNETFTVSVADVPDARILGWGIDGNGLPVSNVPVGLDDAIMVHAGIFHAWAVKADGTLVGWGSNYWGEMNIPFSLPPVRQVAVGQNHVVTLHDGGVLRAWGYNALGQTSIQPGLSGVVKVACGNNSTVALLADGTVRAWGFGMGTLPPGLSGVIDIAANAVAGYALLDDGSVVAWGSNSAGALDVPPGLDDVIAIAAGNASCFALRTDGTVVGWGTFAGAPAGSSVPVGLTDVVQVSNGGFGGHAFALKSDGTVVGWGTSAEGGLDFPLNLRAVSRVAAGGQHGLALIAPGELLLDPIPSLAMRQNTVFPAIPLRVTMPGVDPDAIVVAATSDNQALLPDAGLVISGAMGYRQLRLMPEDDQVGTAEITVTASHGGLSVSRVFEVTVVPPLPPENVALSHDSIYENSGIGSYVGALSAVDPDGVSAAITFALADAALYPDNAAFSVTGAHLWTAAALDFESQASFILGIIATDAEGISSTAELTVTVNNLLELPAKPDAPELSRNSNTVWEASSVATDNASEPLTGLGFVWSQTTSSPTLQNTDGLNSTTIGFGTFAGTIAGLDLATSYTVRAYATNAAGTVYSDSTSFTTTLDSPWPTNLASDGAPTTDGFVASWEPFEGANGYVVEVAEDAKFSAESMLPGYPTSIASGTFLNVSGLDCSKTYFVRVKVANATWADPWSPTVMVTTAGPALLDAWLALWGLPTAEAGGLDDANRDGLLNAFSYLIQRDPFLPAVDVQPGLFQTVGGDVYRYWKHASATAVEPQVIVSEDALSWSTTGLPAPVRHPVEDKAGLECWEVDLSSVSAPFVNLRLVICP